MRFLILSFYLTKALDCLKTNLWKTQLYNMGFRGIFLHWVNRFFGERSLFINLKSSQSQSCDLYNIYFEYLLIWTKFITRFWDNTSMIVSAPFMGDLISSVKNVFKCFKNSFQMNDLILNMSNNWMPTF